MTRTHLRACPGCERHVRVSEEACPFCGGALTESFRTAPAPRAPGARLTRAALFAFGTGAVTLAPDCSSSTAAPVEVYDAAYGGPALDDGGPFEIVDAAYGAPPYDGPQPLYGGPPIELDAGADADAGGSDAGTDAPFLVDAAYGGPPGDSGGD